MPIYREFSDQEFPQPAFSRRIVFRLTEDLSQQIVSWVDQPHATQPFEDLSIFENEPRIKELLEILRSQGLTALPLVPPESQGDILELENRARTLGILEPARTLLGYFVLIPESEDPAFDAGRMVERSVQYSEGVAWSTLEPALRAPALAGFSGAVTDNKLWKDQGYLDGLGIGINTRCISVWGEYDGTGVGFGDIETGWYFNHQDLLTPTGDVRTVSGGGINIDGVAVTTGNRVLRNYCVRHGTKTLGVVVGRDHSGGVPETGAGIVGIAPAADTKLFSRARSFEEQWDLVGAIKDALLVMDFGDVLLIEVETVDPSDAVSADLLYPLVVLPGRPVEVIDYWLDAIRLAVGNGIVVIEPAGNDGANLNEVKPNWRGEYESGAIMVSGCHSAKTAAGTHLHLSSNDSPSVNHGERVDCYAWGENVMTSEYICTTEDEGPITDAYWPYRLTSAASAIIAGAAILVQQMYRKANPGTSLDPLRMRSVLSKLENGTPVETPGGDFKPMPDLGKVATALVGWPDVYIRDRVGDDGSVPNPLVYSSPDIIVRQAPVDIAAELGPASPSAESLPSMDAVVPNQDNFVYVRFLNRASVPVKPAVAHVYWSEASPMVPPSVWHPVGSIDVSQDLEVPANNELAVGGPIIWHPTPTPENLPPSGHGCFVALCGVPGIDGVPPLLPESDAPSWSEFLQYVGSNNNVAWRNFTVADLGSDGTDLYGAAGLVIQGVDEPEPFFDLAMSILAPDGTEVEWKVPQDLFSALRNGVWCIGPGNGTLTSRTDDDGEEVVLTVSGFSELNLQNVRLPALPHRCRLTVRSPAPGTDPIRVILTQSYKGKEVGRLTKEWRAPRR